MRIALFVDAFPLLSESFVVTQLRGLLERGHDVDVLAHHSPHPSARHPAMDDEAIARRVVWHVGSRPPASPGDRGVRGAAGPLAYHIGEIMAAGRWARRRPPRTYDVVHAHFGPMGRRAATLHRFGILSGPLVTTFHANDLTVFPRLYGSGVYRPLFRSGALHLAVSGHGALRLGRLGAPPDRTRVLHLGVDTDDFRFMERTEARPLRLVSVCRLVPKKGMNVALDGLARATEAGVDARYEIIGDGPLLSELRLQAGRLGLDARVRFAGSLAPDAVRQRVMAADVMLQPSLTAPDGDEEGIPVALMEAMATGAVPVAARHAGIPELVEDGSSGLLVNEGDAQGVADAIRRLAGDLSLRADLGRGARARIEEAFSLSEYLDRLVQFYRRLSATGFGEP